MEAKASQRVVERIRTSGRVLVDRSGTSSSKLVVRGKVAIATFLRSQVTKLSTAGSDGMQQQLELATCRRLLQAIL